MKQNAQAIRKWKTENVDTIRFEVKKIYRYPDRIQRAVEMGLATSRQAYITAAIERALNDDGITIDDVSDTE